MSQPWLSILLPTYNGEEFLISALHSIQIQDDDCIECIVVDDGSTDSTLLILENYKSRFPVKILNRERQGNWVANTNYALSFASGEYICFLHQDDIWYRDRLKIMKRLCDQFPDVVLLLHPSDFIGVDNINYGPWRCPLPIIPEIINSDLMIEKLLIQNFISIPAPIFKRRIVLEVGGLDENLWYTADWDLWLKMAGCGGTLYYPKPLSGFRIHPNSQTILRSSYLQLFREQLEYVKNKYLHLWDVSQPLKSQINKIASFSIEVNVALAGLIHGEKVRYFWLLKSFLLLGPLGQYRYLRDSRIWERVTARLRARIAAPRKVKQS
ncbi:MAG: glycosyltransferase [Chloroflexi bacterium]|nr:glycosyltransferase [Chloroflexota bacterium]